MGSKSHASVALFFAFNILLFSLTSACNTCSNPIKPTPKPSTPSTPSSKSCPRDALKLGVCADLLNGLVGAVVGKPPTVPCCSVIEGLLDLEVAVCLCTAIKANVLGININIPVALSLIIDGCGKKLPKDFQCA